MRSRRARCLLRTIHACVLREAKTSNSPRILSVCPIKVSFVISHFFSFFKVILIIRNICRRGWKSLPVCSFLTHSHWNVWLLLIPDSNFYKYDSEWWFRWIEQHCFLWCRSLHLYLHRYSYACYCWNRNDKKKTKLIIGIHLNKPSF